MSDPNKIIEALTAQSDALKAVARDLREALESIPYMVNSPEIVWEGIESAPTDGKQIWVSDGFAVWSITAWESGDHKRGAASRCKYWTRYLMPAPPSVTVHPPGPRQLTHKGRRSSTVRADEGNTDV